MAASASLAARAADFEDLCTVALGHESDSSSQERKVLDAFLGASPEFSPAPGASERASGSEAGAGHPLHVLSAWGFETLPGGGCRVDPDLASKRVVSWRISDETLREGVPAAFTEAAVLLLLLVVRMTSAPAGPVEAGEAFGAVEDAPSSARLWTFHALTSDSLLGALLAAVPEPARRAALPAGTAEALDGAARRGNEGGHLDPRDPPAVSWCCLWWSRP
ncbi:hypothetical protein FNF29_07908 [Cafeteria roenbergensis]|uniref:Uncharacterized protein n=1 Tax=Cafeteria roenbergensis TaxID=33653 RepID=A0A5A8C0Z0_CAFRO|nr:hypothetical protein FNF29_07908 [Cafeteria roenbergensis]|eukprot:KAA0146666.1 hypothetical protein FNF29_07908 [Cafeteria roenbergensis]